MKINNSDYKKTFFYEDLKQTNIVVATLNNNSSLIEYLENLIFDLIEKRHLNDKKIVFLVDNLWTSQFLADLLIIRKVIDDKYIISNTTNFISIIDINSDFKFLMSESSMDISNKRGDILILIDFDVLMNEFHKQISELRGYYENSLWIGVCINSGEKVSMRYLSLGDKENDVITYLPESPETFNGFVNEYVLKGVEEILDTLGDNEVAGIFSKQLHGEIFNMEENITKVLKIGTSDYFEYFDEEDEVEYKVEHDFEGGFADSFCVTISISKYSLIFSMVLQDYNWDGTNFLNYEFDFETDIYEKADIREINDLVQNACERIKCQNVYIDLS